MNYPFGVSPADIPNWEGRELTDEELDRQLHEEGCCEDGCRFCIEAEENDQPNHPPGCKCGDCGDWEYQCWKDEKLEEMEDRNG